jgi:hypothetical protein
VFKAIPNTASKEFPKLHPRRFKNSISFLSKLPGIFWAGVRVTIGESGGYYTMRNPVSIARIEGIEGSARLECELDTSGNILLIRPIFELEGLSDATHFAELIQPITTLSTVSLIQEMIHTYIEHSGGEEILEEVLEDILTFQAKHQPDDAKTN